MILEERNEVSGIAEAISVGALKASVVGGLRQISVDGEAVMVKGSLVGDILFCIGCFRRCVMILVLNSTIVLEKKLQLL